MSMTITLDGKLAARIQAEAERTGMHPHGLALAALLERFPYPIPTPEEVDAKMARLRALAIPAGVSLPNEAFLGEALYD